MLVNLESTVAKGVCGYFTTAQHMKLAKNFSQKTYLRGNFKLYWFFSLAFIDYRNKNARLFGRF
jgi:hypothetical protein